MEARAELEKEEVTMTNVVDRRDLDMLLESYGRMIEFNNKVMHQQSSTLDRIDKLSEIQKNVIQDIAGSTHVLVENHKECFKHRDELAKLVQKNKVDDSKEHFRQDLKMWGLVGTMGLMVLGLIGLLAKVWPTVDYVAQIIAKNKP